MEKILIIDDDPEICNVISRLVKLLGHDAQSAHTLEKGLWLALNNDVDIIFLDLQFPEGNGLDILPELIRSPSFPEVIIITGSGVAAAELAFKYGAWDYVQKPFLPEEITLPLSRALQYRKEKETAASPVPLKRPDIIGNSPAINSCIEAVARSAATDASVLITGETGTGKELFARAIHANSKRSQNNFIVVDCGALPETLVESILFGYEKGAFTGADKGREGLIAQADGGTIFLDEIGELPYSTQKAFLRTIQERRIRPIGARQESPVDFRLVAATNRDLEEMVNKGTFREDLLFRIRAIEIKLPPLRDRTDDIREITIQKIQRLCQQYDIGIKGISQDFLETLQDQAWPGNVRELVNVLEYSLASAGNDPVLIPKHIPHQYRAASLRKASSEVGQNDDLSAEKSSPEIISKTLAQYREENLNRIERLYLVRLQEQVGADRHKASTISGLSKSQLYALLKKHDLAGFKG